jgi:hypothetical protein
LEAVGPWLFADEERAELIGALTNAVTFADALLEACRHASVTIEPPTRVQ